MRGDERDHERSYKVVVNGEAQYSIWPLEQPAPDGWTEVGPRGSKAECLAYIRDAWTDMRPLSLRRREDRTADDGDQGPSRDPRKTNLTRTTSATGFSSD
jgi:MbtH protein